MSVKGEGKNYVWYLVVNFIIIDLEGVEKKYEWKSEEEEKKIEGLFCGKCYIEIVMRIRLIGDKMLVSV